MIRRVQYAQPCSEQGRRWEKFRVGETPKVSNFGQIIRVPPCELFWDPGFRLQRPPSSAMALPQRLADFVLLSVERPSSKTLEIVLPEHWPRGVGGLVRFAKIFP